MPINRIKDDQGRTRWQFEFDRYIGGERIRLRRSLPAGWTRAQADAFDRSESGRLYAIAKGIEKPRYTIEDAIGKYGIERVPELKHGKNTMAEIDLMEPYWSGKPIESLPDVCAAYLRDHRDTLAPATIRNRLRYLVAACRYAWKKHGMGESDPGARVVMPSVSNERQTYIDRRQMLMLAKACTHWETRALIRIAFYSGMRLGEIVAAKVEDGYFVLPDSKNGEPVRIPIHRKVRAFVDYQWPTRFIIGYHFRAARELVGLGHLHFHDIRHSTASDLVNRGVDLYTVGAVLRHKSQASTRRYAHLRDDRVTDAINLIGKRA